MIPKMFYFYNFIFCENFCDWPKGDEIISSGLDQSKVVVYASKNKNVKKSFCIKCLLPSISANFLHLFYNLKFWQKIENWSKYLVCNYFNFPTHVTNYSSKIWFCFVSLCNTRRPENRFFSSRKAWNKR